MAIAKNDNEHLYNALDIDLITDTGESTGIISNHKGNKLQFSIPNIQPLFSIKFTPVGLPGATTLSINSTAVVISLSSISDSFDIYSQIIANVTIAADIALGRYGVYYNTQEVLIQGYSLNPNVSVTLGNDLTVTTVVAAQTNLSISPILTFVPPGLHFRKGLQKVCAASFIMFQKEPVEVCFGLRVILTLPRSHPCYVSI